MFRSTSLRLAALYTAGFSLAVAILGLITILSTRAVLTDQFDARLRADQVPLIEGYQERGLYGLLHEMAEASQGSGALIFGVQTEAGKPVDGPLAALHAPLGLSRVRFVIGGKPETLRVLTEEMGDSRYRLMVGDKADRIDSLSRRVLLGFSLAFAALLVVGIVAGLALSRAVQKRMAAISGTAEAIIDGDLGRRVPAQGDDDLSRLAATLNRMLDRIGVLMDSLRQVTSDVAHDLRTPLNRLRQRLERSARQADDPAHKAEIEGALGDVDAILATFAALLRISEVEAGARRAAFRRLDLRALTRAVAEDFAPVAEDSGHRLQFEDGPPVWIEGDAELLTQMIVNLVENALHHTPKGCAVRLAADEAGGEPVLIVSDDGPGVPDAELGRLFDRFYRLERSRSTPGSGLGLALVQAVAKLHRGEARLSGGAPGLEARIVFPAAS